jgi:hypothetical protein
MAENAGRIVAAIVLLIAAAISVFFYFKPVETTPWNTGASGDTNFSIWNGANWTPFGPTKIQFSGLSIPSYFNQPTFQDAASGQPIFNISNNGTGASTGLSMRVNASKSWSFYTCGTNTSHALGVNLTTVNQVVNSTAVAVNGYYLVYCWYSINTTAIRDQSPVKIMATIS